MTPRALPFRPTAAGLLLAAHVVACDGATHPEIPDEEHPAPVLLDVSDTLEAVAGAADTFHVEIPPERVMGAILESSHPILVRWGGNLFDVIFSNPGGPFAALVPFAGTGQRRLIVRRATGQIEETHYRLRIIAVDDAPEHGSRDLVPGSSFRSEWIDPPLDRDLFDLELEQGQHFRIEMESESADVPLTAMIVQPDRLSYYVFVSTAQPVARSSVYEVSRTGRHALVVYSAGLRPDVETRYRFRVVLED